MDVCHLVNGWIALNGGGMVDPNCNFCGIVADPQSAHVVWADDEHVAFLDRNPVAEGHVLLVPRAHVANTRSGCRRHGPLRWSAAGDARVRRHQAGRCLVPSYSRGARMTASLL
ncbi:MAG: HIT family protein [Actinomycetota bacterium]